MGGCSAPMTLDILGESYVFADQEVYVDLAYVGVVVLSWVSGYSSNVP